MSTEPLDARTHRALSGTSRVAILELLRVAGGPMDVPSIAARVALHPNTVRSHLDRLIEVGLVEMGAAGEEVDSGARPGRPRLLYGAVAPPAEVPENSYRLLAGMLAGSLADGSAGKVVSGIDAAVLAGQDWGRTLARRDERHAGTAAVEHIVEILDEVGFSPKLGESDADAAQVGQVVIELHQCPFLEVAKEHSQIVCSVHRGLMQGALERMHAPTVSVTLQPFARPGLCLARLALPAAS